MQPAPKKKSNTLLIVLVAVGGGVLLLGCVALTIILATGTAVVGELDGARHEATRTQALEIQMAATLYLVQGNPDCPSPDDLVANGLLSPGTSTRDAWGREFYLECNAGEVIVTSPGPDSQIGTEDDIASR